MKTITVHLTDRAFDDLEAASYAEALSCTDVINRAVSLYSALSAIREPTRVVLERPDGSVWRSLVVEEGAS